MLLTGVYGPLVLYFMMICALACACAPGEFDSPEWYGPGAALPLWCAACPAPGAAVVAAAWLAASVLCVGGFLRRCCGWCRSSSPCWSGRSGTVGLYSMGKLRFRCCVTLRRLPGFGGILYLIFYLTGPCWFSRFRTWLRWWVFARLRAAVSGDARRSVGSTQDY